MWRLTVNISTTGLSRWKKGMSHRSARAYEWQALKTAVCSTWRLVPKVPKKPCMWGQEVPMTVHGVIPQKTRYLPPNNLKPKSSHMKAYIDNLLPTNSRTPLWKTYVDMTVFPTERAVSIELYRSFKTTSASIRDDSVLLIPISRHSQWYYNYLH
jgi:hypothetical protein